MTNPKAQIENYCKYWRFKQYTIPKIQKYISNYLVNVLNKSPDLIPVRMSATEVSLRKPDDANLQDGLDVRVDWFDELKPFEDAINPTPNFYLIGWLLSDTMRLFDKNEPRIFSRENFNNYYFYFDYHQSTQRQQTERLLERYQNIAYHNEKYVFISNISENNTIMFNQYYTATPKEIAKVLAAIDRITPKS